MLPSSGTSAGMGIVFRALLPIPLMSTWYLSACLMAIASMRLQCKHNWGSKHYMHKHSFLQCAFN